MFCLTFQGLCNRNQTACTSSSLMLPCPGTSAWPPGQADQVPWHAATLLLTAVLLLWMMLPSMAILLPWTKSLPTIPKSAQLGYPFTQWLCRRHPLYTRVCLCTHVCCVCVYMCIWFIYNSTQNKSSKVEIMIMRDLKTMYGVCWKAETQQCLRSLVNWWPHLQKIKTIAKKDYNNAVCVSHRPTYKSKLKGSRKSGLWWEIYSD